MGNSYLIFISLHFTIIITADKKFLLLHHETNVCLLMSEKSAKLNSLRVPLPRLMDFKHFLHSLLKANMTEHSLMSFFKRHLFKLTSSSSRFAFFTHAKSHAILERFVVLDLGEHNYDDRFVFMTWGKLLGVQSKRHQPHRNWLHPRTCFVNFRAHPISVEISKHSYFSTKLSFLLVEFSCMQNVHSKH